MGIRFDLRIVSRWLGCLAAFFVIIFVNVYSHVAFAYPNRPIKIVVPLSAGTGLDLLVRDIADQLSTRLGTPVYVDNQPGAALTLAGQIVARSEPDGYTLLVSTTLPMVGVSLVRNLGYDPERDFIPLSVYATAPFVLIVSTDRNLKKFADFVPQLRGHPLIFGSSGAGGLSHLAMELLLRRVGIIPVHVPYRNSGQAIIDVMGGNIDAAMSEVGVALELIREGKVSPLGITSLDRHPELPDVPSLSESGQLSDLEMVAWHVLAAPRATPQAVLNLLRREIAAITDTARFHTRARAVGLVARPTMEFEAMMAFIESERKKWRGAFGLLGDLYR